MKILLAANRNPYFHNTNYYRERAVAALGHVALVVDIADRRWSGRLGMLMPFLRQGELARINDELVKCAEEKDPDQCWVIGGEIITFATVRKIRAMGIPVVLWTTDAPVAGRFEKVVSSAAAYTHVFCAGSEAVDLLKRAKGVEASWLPFACDAQVHAPVDLSTSEKLYYSRDIAFVGSYYPNRAEVLGALTDFELGIWGPLWSRAKAYPDLGAFIEDGPVDVDVWKKIYASASIVAVIHYQDGVTPCHQASPKLFEAMACGAFVLCDAQQDAQALFKDGEHLVFFHDKVDLKNKVAYYLEHGEARARIAAAGRAKVLAEHTYIKRVEAIFKVMASDKPQVKA